MVASSIIKQLGCCGVLVWLAISGVFATFFVGEYLTRPEEDKSFWKAGVQVSVLSSYYEMTIIFLTMMQGIYCTGSILGTGAGLTAFIFLIGNTIKNKIDDDPNT